MDGAEPEDGYPLDTSVFRIVYNNTYVPPMPPTVRIVLLLQNVYCEDGMLSLVNPHNDIMRCATSVQANPYCSNVFVFSNVNMQQYFSSEGPFFGCACLRVNYWCEPEYEGAYGTGLYVIAKAHTRNQDSLATFHRIRSNAMCELTEYTIHFPRSIDVTACARRVYENPKCDKIYMYSPRTYSCACIMVGFPCIYEEPEAEFEGGNIYNIDFVPSPPKVVLQATFEKSVCPNFENQGDYYRYDPHKAAIENVCGEEIVPYICVKNNWYNNEYDYGKTLTCQTPIGKRALTKWWPGVEHKKAGVSPWIYVLCILSLAFVRFVFIFICRSLPNRKHDSILMEELIEDSQAQNIPH